MGLPKCRSNNPRGITLHNLINTCVGLRIKTGTTAGGGWGAGCRRRNIIILLTPSRCHGNNIMRYRNFLSSNRSHQWQRQDCSNNYIWYYRVYNTQRIVYKLLYFTQISIFQQKNKKPAVNYGFLNNIFQINYTATMFKKNKPYYSLPTYAYNAIVFSRKTASIIAW